MVENRRSWNRSRKHDATARAVGAVNSQLDLLLTRAFAVAKRVRTETAVGSSAVSVASVAVELAKKIFGTLKGKHVCLVGAGKMSELAARHLQAHGAASIFVANRTYERAQQLAAKFNGEAIHFNDLYDSCDRADIVITSTGAPVTIFKREHGERFLARRGYNSRCGRPTTSRPCCSSRVMKWKLRSSIPPATKLPMFPWPGSGTKGMFTKEIEEALAGGRVDLAVHSLKDLPTELSPGFSIAAVTQREDPRDVFCSLKFQSIEELPQAARVGTSSLRRQAQFESLAP